MRSDSVHQLYRKSSTGLLKTCIETKVVARNDQNCGVVLSTGTSCWAKKQIVRHPAASLILQVLVPETSITDL
jgi:hypothetical protein